MSYLFNRTNVFIVIVVGVIFTLSLNELVKLTQKFRLSQVEKFVRTQLDLKTYGSQESCQEKSLYLCEYAECNFIPPGKTVEETCGANFVPGWQPTNIPIPEFFQNIDTIRLTIETDRSTGTIELLTRRSTASYYSTAFDDSETDPREQKIPQNDITRLINKMVLYELSTTLPETTPIPSEETHYTLYLASKKVTPLGIANADDSIKETTIRCVKNECSNELHSIIDTIIRIWGDPILEQ